MMMEFSNDSLAQRRSVRLQEVARMEDLAVGKGAARDVLVLDTSSSNSSNHSSSSSTAPPMTQLRRGHTIDCSSTGNRRPSDVEIRSLWRMRVNQIKLDDLSCRSMHSHA
ncbi:expressed unknown protein [Seminavis robusta]|uniref:Uncharacterized protein n=1 Tax=Seminavis robusta TaxID=568900 RepID=A0A9N8HHL3_9STRA|nr:expressed unknown protein [Seminavis robusta]|eukprot:Sro454_g146360.1 n/a (110) ;mRNA; r:36763-37092